MASTRSTHSLSPSVVYRSPRGWRELPGSLAALEGDAWKAWARDYLVAIDDSPELTFGAADEPAAERLPYPLTVIHEELSALQGALGGRAAMHAFGSGKAMARLYIVVPAEDLGEHERGVVTAAVLQWIGDRVAGTGLLGPDEDLEYFEVDVENDDEGGAALAVLWPSARLLAYARAAEHDDAVTALAGLQLADYRVDIREALAGQ